MQDWCFSNTRTATSNLITHRMAQDVPEHNYSEEMRVICVSKEACVLRQQLASYLPPPTVVLLAFSGAVHPEPPCIYGGPLGGGSFTNNEEPESKWWLTTVSASLLFFLHKRRGEGDPHQGCDAAIAPKT